MCRVNAQRIKFVTAGALLGAILLAGGCSRTELATVDDLRVVKYRYTIDDSANVVRVVGEVRNDSSLPTPEAEIVATLHSRTGSTKGQNRVGLERLEAGGTEMFALAVTSHGTLKSVELTIVEPGTVLGEDDEDEEADEAEADDGEGD